MVAYDPVNATKYGKDSHDPNDDFVNSHTQILRTRFLSMMATTTASTGASIQYRAAALPVIKST
jgi:hypothetical protein